jgi:hypothetical protein
MVTQRSQAVRTLAVVLLSGAAASAQSLSSGFTGTGIVSSTAPDNGNMFDISAFASGGITINSFDIHSTAALGTPLTVDLYYKPGTYVGSANNPAAWTFVGTANPTAAGPNLPTPLALGGISIPGGQTYGIYFNIREIGASIRYYTVPQLPTTNPANDDLAIEVRSGGALGGLFGTLFAPRGWNGTVYYSAVGSAPTGACCLPTGGCDVRTAGSCINASGTYNGDGSLCASVQCFTGACCRGDGTCEIVSQSWCAATGGAYRGDNVACASVVCPLQLSAGFGGNGVVSNTTINTGNMFDVTVSAPGGITLQRFDIHSNGATGNPITVDVYYKQGSYVGFTADPFAWTLLGTANTTAAGVGLGTPVDVGTLTIPANETYAFYINIREAGSPIRYYTLAQLPAANPSNDHLLIDVRNGVANNGLFGSTFSPRGFNGVLYYTLGAGCYPNCDGSTTSPILNVADFSCFLQSFAAGTNLPHAQQLTHYSNCDQSTTPPVLNVADFSCFLQAFAAGCP